MKGEKLKFQNARAAVLPRLKTTLKDVLDRARGLPPVSGQSLGRELLTKCIAKDDPVILEIGANDGDSTLWLNDSFRNPTIHCFEPDPRAIARFKAKVGTRENIALHELALGDRCGEVEFYQSSGRKTDSASGLTQPVEWDLSGSIRPPKEHLTVYPWVEFRHRITVKSSTLDAWMKTQNFNVVDFVWMDVQGAELDVFRGAARSLERIRYIYSEYSNRELYSGQSDLKSLMRHLTNFELVARYPGDALFRNLAFKSRTV